MLLGILATGVAGIAVLLAVSAWLLAAGPLSLTFLSPYVADALRQAELRPRVHFDDLVLTWAGWGRPLDVRITGVRLIHDNGDVVASAPEVSVGLRTGALIRGRMAVTRLEMRGAEASLVRGSDGRVTFGPPGEDAGSGDLAGRLLEELLRPPDGTRMAGDLRRLSIVDADITLDDRIARTSWHVPAAKLALLRDEAGLKGNAELDFELGGVLAHLGVEAVYDNVTRVARVEIRFSDIDPTRLQGLAAALAPLAAVRMPVSGSVEFAVDSAGSVSGIAFDLEAGPGHLDLSRFYPKPQPVARFSAQGHVADSLDALIFDSFSVDLGGPSAAMTGTLWVSEGQFGVRAEGEVRNVGVADIKRLWPPKLGPRARRWLLTHLHEGLIPEGTFRIDAPPGVLTSRPLPDDTVALDFRFEGGVMAYYSAMPPVTDGRGTARMSAAKFDLTLAEGRNGGLVLSDGTLSISGLNQPRKHAEIAVVVVGSVQEAMTLLDREPLGYARRFHLDPSSIGGEAAARLRFRFPLEKELLPARLQFSAAANLSDAAVLGLFGKYDLTEGTLALKVDGRGLTLSGHAALNDVPLQIDWHRSLEPEAAVRTRYVLSGNLDDSGRDALFLSTGDYLKGPVSAKLEVLVGDDAALQATAEVDLTAARASAPALRWHKPAETEGSLRISLSRPADGDLVVDSFTLAAADLAASGQVSFGAKGSLRRLELSRLAFGGPQGTDVTASLLRREDGGYALTLGGNRLDLRPYLDRSDEDDERAAPPPLSLTARVNRLTLGETLELRDVTATASHDGASWQGMELSGSVNGGAPLDVTLTPQDGGRRLKVTSADAGSVARALDLFFKAEGGRLEVNAVIHDDLPGRPVEGEVTIKDFRLIEAPPLARILTLGSLTGIYDLLNGDGIRFVRFSAPFTLAEDKITLKGARAHGPAVGITLDGVIDRGAGTTDIRGSIVPAYTINSFLGKIPLLGKLLIGKEGEGLLGLAYSAKGTSEEPLIKVNPLSVLAPGFLRRIFFLGSKGEDRPVREEDDGAR